MIDKNKESGMVGLGRMGENPALQALQEGIRVVGFDAGKVPDDLPRTAMVMVHSFAELKKEFHRPRRIFYLYSCRARRPS